MNGFREKRLDLGDIAIVIEYSSSPLEEPEQLGHPDQGVFDNRKDRYIRARRAEGSGGNTPLTRLLSSGNFRSSAWLGSQISAFSAKDLITALHILAREDRAGLIMQLAQKTSPRQRFDVFCAALPILMRHHRQHLSPASISNLSDAVAFRFAHIGPVKSAVTHLENWARYIWEFPEARPSYHLTVAAARFLSDNDGYADFARSAAFPLNNRFHNSMANCNRSENRYDLIPWNRRSPSSPSSGGPRSLPKRSGCIGPACRTGRVGARLVARGE